jgi:hypothetical protein
MYPMRRPLHTCLNQGRVLSPYGEYVIIKEKNNPCGGVKWRMEYGLLSGGRLNKNKLRGEKTKHYSTIYGKV